LWARNVFGIDSEDMESAAVAQVSRSFGVPFVPVRIISNSELLGAEFQVETGAVCARFVLRFLEAFVGAPGSSAPSFSAKFEEIKRQATPVELYAFLYDLPKGGDLHNHLGGSGLAETWFRLATDKARNGGREYFTRLRINNCGTCPAPLIYFHTIQEATWKALPPCCRSEYEPMSQLSPEQKQAWMSSVKLDRPQEGRHEFFEVIWSRLNDLLRDATVISELMVENMKLFGREGVRYIEWQLGPFLRTEGSKTLEPDELSRLFRARLEKPDAKETGVEVRLLANVLRFAPDAEQRIEEAYAFVDGHRDLWVGINLVGREDNDKGYPLRFLKTFRRMRRRYSNIGLAIHGGEVDEPNRHVRDTLLLGATRIGHGLNLVTDPETLLLMRGGRYLVEHSLVSNQLLEYTPDLDEHPFPEYLRLGIPVSLATDDRGMWDSNLTDEYFSAVGHFNLSWEELVQIGRNSLEFAFLDAETKAQLMASYESDVAAFEKKYAGGDWRELLTGVGPAVSGYAERSFGIERN
ncbi:MAG: adenosine deaminase, partial [Acidobacteriota bacterium]